MNKYFMRLTPLFLLALLSSISCLASAPFNEPANFQLTEQEQAFLAENPIVRIGAMNNWPPFNFVDSHGRAVGIGADYVRLLNKRIGGALEIVSGDWHSLYEDVKHQRLDALLDLTPKAERKEYFHFTEPYLNVPHAIIAKKTMPYIHNEEGLRGKVLALEQGFGNVAYFRDQYPDVQIKQYQNTSYALDAVVRGEADAYAGNRSVALHVIGQEVMTTLKAHGRLQKDGSILAIGIRKDWPILASILDKALADIKPEEIREVQNRWIGDKVTLRPVELTSSEKSWLEQHPKITIAFDANYPPYSFINERGEFAGIAVDMAKELAQKVGIEFEIYSNGEWKQIYAAGKEGRVDVIATLVKRRDREKWFEFTRPYISLSQFIISRQSDSNNYQTPDDLSGKLIALVEGYSTSDLILEQQPNVRPYYVENLVDALTAVSRGRADATVADIAMSNHMLTRYGVQNLAYAHLYTRDHAKQRFGVRKDWQTLAVILDKALESFTYQELMSIYARWNVPNYARPEAGFLSVTDELTEEERAWLEAHPQIQLASDAAWPPFESIENGIYAGIAADYMKLIEQRLGITFVQSPVRPWRQITEMLQMKTLDVFSCAMETQERNEYASFTAPYISNPMMIITRNDISYINGLNGLEGATVAIEEGYASHDLLLRQHPTLKLQPYPDSLSALLAVSKGETFAYIGNIAVVSHIIRNHGINNVKISGQTPYNFELAMGVRNDWPELVPILQKALDSISLEERNAILQKWISIKVDKPFNLYWVGGGVGFTLLLASLVLYWNFMLNSRVKEHASKLAYQTNFDALTGLPNRYLSVDRLEQLTSEAQMNGKVVAVLSLDIDDFKKVNDSLDYDTGNKLLVAVAKRLREYIHGNDTLARPGADQFLLIAGNIQQIEDVTLLAESLFSAFKDSFCVDNHEIVLTVSIGIAIYPDDGDESSDLLKYADAAMHHAKQSGRNTVSYYTESMNREVNRRLELEERMHGALERNEFAAHFQPKIDIKTGRIVGFEVLLRWNSPGLGSVSPVEFIPIAEHNGLIVPIGEYVLERALDAAKQLQQQFGVLFSFAVNLSPRQFTAPNLASRIELLLAEADVPPQIIELEITEGVLMNGSANIVNTLAAIKALGVGLAIDDFGTGYSSLSYLRQYPFNTLKIDREFITDIADNMADQQLVNATIAMSHGLGLKVVAEGVETEEQYSLLGRSRCDLAQGYLFSKPLSFEDMCRLLIEHPHWLQGV